MRGKQRLDVLAAFFGQYNDARSAVRGIILARHKAPGFKAAAVISIALGMAANTTVFSMVNAMLLGALPVRDPGGLYALDKGNTFSYPEYRDFRYQCAGVFDGLAGEFPLSPASLAIPGGRPRASPPSQEWHWQR